MVRDITPTRFVNGRGMPRRPLLVVPIGSVPAANAMRLHLGRCAEEAIAILAFTSITRFGIRQ